MTLIEPDLPNAVFAVPTVCSSTLQIVDDDGVSTGTCPAARLTTAVIIVITNVVQLASDQPSNTAIVIIL